MVDDLPFDRLRVYLLDPAIPAGIKTNLRSNLPFEIANSSLASSYKCNNRAERKHILVKLSEIYINIFKYKKIKTSGGRFSKFFLFQILSKSIKKYKKLTIIVTHGALDQEKVREGERR